MDIATLKKFGNRIRILEKLYMEDIYYGFRLESGLQMVFYYLFVSLDFTFILQCNCCTSIHYTHTVGGWLARRYVNVCSISTSKVCSIIKQR